MGTQDYVGDPRNQDIRIYLNGAMVHRAEAAISVFDSGFVLGDGVWEGFRLHHGRIAFLDHHLDRLYDGARAIDLDVGLSRQAFAGALAETIAANGMTDGVHIRAMVTRGVKKTPNQDPRHALGQSTVVIIAEHKVPDPEAQRRGISLFTSAIRSARPDTLDPRLNSHSRLGLIVALIQAIHAGADEALLLDPDGFVSTCNATNFFFVKRGVVRTATGKYAFPGITRGHVIALCHAGAAPIELGDFTLAEVYAADEAFVTGTFGGLTPVVRIDGRPVGTGAPGRLTAALREHYRQLLDAG